VLLINCTLLSIRELTKKNWSVTYSPNDVTTLRNDIIDIELKASWKSNVYYLDCQLDTALATAYIGSITPNIPITLIDRLHKRFLHASQVAIIQTLKHVEINLKSPDLSLNLSSKSLNSPDLSFDLRPESPNLPNLSKLLECQACEKGKFT